MPWLRRSGGRTGGRSRQPRRRSSLVTLGGVRLRGERVRFGIPTPVGERRWKCPPRTTGFTVPPWRPAPSTERVPSSRRWRTQTGGNSIALWRYFRDNNARGSAALFLSRGKCVRRRQLRADVKIFRMALHHPMGNQVRFLTEEEKRAKEWTTGDRCDVRGCTDKARYRVQVPLRGNPEQISVLGYCESHAREWANAAGVAFPTSMTGPAE